MILTLLKRRFVTNRLKGGYIESVRRFSHIGCLFKENSSTLFASSQRTISFCSQNFDCVQLAAPTLTNFTLVGGVSLRRFKHGWVFKNSHIALILKEIYRRLLVLIVLYQLWWLYLLTRRKITVFRHSQSWLEHADFGTNLSLGVFLWRILTVSRLGRFLAKITRRALHSNLLVNVSHPAWFLSFQICLLICWLNVISP